MPPPFPISLLSSSFLFLFCLRSTSAQIAPGQSSIMQNELVNIEYPVFSCTVEARHVLGKVPDGEGESEGTSSNFYTDEELNAMINENPEEYVGTIIDERTREYTYLHRGTTLGLFEFELRPDWSPEGVKRFVAMFNDNYFSNLPLYRIVPDFLVQFGLSGTPSMTQKWLQSFPDDDFPASLTGEGESIPFKRGYMSFAGSGEKDSRTNQFFVSYNDENTIGTLPWEVPFARILSGMDVLEAIYPSYKDEVSQEDIAIDGEIYLKKNFPQLSYITYCTHHGRIATVDPETYMVSSWRDDVEDVMAPTKVEYAPMASLMKEQEQQVSGTTTA